MERYIIYKDFNTKDWVVHDDITGCNPCRCDTEEEAEQWIKRQETKQWNNTKSNLATRTDTLS